MSEVNNLIADLKSNDRAVRGRAAEELSYLSEDAAPAAVALIGVLNDNETTHEWAVSALEDLGPPPVEVLPALCELLTADEDAGYWAATLLGRLEEDAASAVPALVEALKSAPMAVRQRAAWALGNIGPDANVALSALEAAASDGDPRLSRLATSAIEDIRDA